MTALVHRLHENSVSRSFLRRAGMMLAFALAFLGSPGSSVARDLCVTCQEPFAVYRCTFDENSPFHVTAPGASLVCAKELAKRGGHARCGVQRNSFGSCEGELVYVTPPAEDRLPPAPRPGMEPLDPEGLPVPPDAMDASADVDDLAPVAEPAPEPEGPPKTVEELAKRTARSTKQGLQDAGEAVAGATRKTGEKIGEAGSAIGGAAKSTWRCLSSLFTDC